VAAKFEIQKTKTKVSWNIISHFIVSARVGNIWSLTVIREVLQNWWHRWVHKPRSHYSFILWQPWYQYYIYPCFGHVGPRASFTPPPTLSSIPFSCTHWIQNPSNACAWTDTKFCHKTWFITMPQKQRHKPKFLSLGTFAKLWQTIISFNMSLHQSVCPLTSNDSALTWWIFMKLVFWGFF